MKVIKAIVLISTFLFLPALAQKANEQKPQLYVQTGFDSTIESFAFSPDGKLFATGDSGDFVKLWDAENGRELRTLGAHTQMVLSVAFSPDGKILASGGEDGEIILWNVARGEKLKTLSGHGKDVVSLAFSPDGKFLASGGWDKSVKLWDAESGKLLKTFKTQPKSLVQSVAFSPDGKTLAASDGNLIRLWDAGSGRELKILRGHLATVDSVEAFVNSIAFSPDGALLASAGDDKIIKIWNVANGREVKSLTGHADKIFKLEFARSGKSIVSGSWDGTFRRWDLLNGQSKILVEDAVKNAGDENGVFAVSPDEKILARAFSSRVEFYDLTNGQPVKTLRGQSQAVKTVLLSRDGKYLASGGSDKKVRLWSAASGEMKTLGSLSEAVFYYAFSPDNRLLASSSWEEIKIWDISTGKELKTFTLSGGHKPVSFSPDGKFLAAYNSNCADQARCLGVWEIESGKFAELEERPEWFEDNSTSPCRSGAIGADKINLEAACEGASWLKEPLEIKFTGGKQSATLYVFGESDWLVVTGEGLFDGTPNAWRQLIWRFNGDTFDYGSLELYFNDFFYPNLLQEIFSGKSPRAKAGLELEKIDRRQPTIEIASIDGQSKNKTVAQADNKTANGKRTATLSLEIIDNAAAKKQPEHGATSGAQDLRLFRNGSLVRIWRGDVFDAAASGCEKIPTKLNEPRRTRCSAEIAVAAGENNFTAYAFNSANVKSNDAAASFKSDAARRGGTLYVLAVGVNKYANASYDLRFAVPDVLDIGAAIKDEQAKLQTDADLKQYAETKVITLTDEAATRKNILLALHLFTIDGAKMKSLPENLCADLSGEVCARLKTELGKIKATEPEDALLIYYAGHGTSRGQRFYLLPHDFTGAVGEEDLSRQSVSDIELNDALERVDAGKLLMTIDACQSGRALGEKTEGRAPTNSKGLAQLAYDKGMLILTATQSQEAAKEAAEIDGQKIEHGLLTYALLKGLQNARADADGDKKLTEREWLDYAVGQVPLLQSLTGNRGTIIKNLNGKSTAASEPKRQTPRVFYRRETETNPLIMAK